MRLLLAVFVGSALVAPQVAWAWLPRDDSRMRIIRDNLCYETECGDLERVKKLVQEIAEDLPNVDLGDLNTNDWYILTDWSTGIYQVTDFGPGFSEDTQRRLCQSALDFMRGIRSISSYHDIDGIAFGACVAPDGAIDKHWYYEREAQIKLEALRIVEASGFGDAWEMKLRAGSRLCERDGLDCGVGARLMAEAILTPSAVRLITSATVDFDFNMARQSADRRGASVTDSVILRAASYEQCRIELYCGQERLLKHQEYYTQHPEEWRYPLSITAVINGEWVEWGREQYGLDFSGEPHADEIDHAGQANGSDGESEATDPEGARAREGGGTTGEAPAVPFAQALTSEPGAPSFGSQSRWRWLVFAVVFAALGTVVIALLRRRRRASDVGPDV